MSSNSSRDWLNYKECRNSVNTEIKRAKGLSDNNAFQVNGGEPRATWRIVNELYARKPTNSNVNKIKMNSHSIADAQELAETLNCHLTGIELKLASVTPNGNRSLLEYLSLNLDYENYFVLKQTPDVAIVYSFLSELSQSKVTALAHISVRQLRECADLIAPSLCSIFRAVLFLVFLLMIGSVLLK